MRLLSSLCLLFGLILPLAAQKGGPFKWQPASGSDYIQVEAIIPDGYYLYKDETSLVIELDDHSRSLPVAEPEAVAHKDEVFGETMIYPAGKAAWRFPKTGPGKLMIKYQGCSEKGMCYRPASAEYSFDGEKFSGGPAVEEKPPGSESTPLEMLSEYQIRTTGSGYMNSRDFLAFLQREHSESLFADKSLFVIILLIILGGLGLNLTPCVLPMIPINLAIIGADASNRKQGFIRGSAYGLGIALAYGVLGLVVILTGARFGALNSSAWFNFAVALIFVVLSLAMFDLIHIDFSRFTTSVNTDKMRLGKLATAFVMGIVAALLAGACVAPVVIAVLLFASSYYGQGYWPALLLPFLLGAGMALPWPFAGAGLAILPKPGKWMVRIKNIFGVIIVLAALWYGWLGYTLLPVKSTSESSAGAEIARLENALKEGRNSSKPLLIDFWATWCKNCLAMNEGAFKDPGVIKELENFQVVKFQAEDMSEPEVKKILDYFNISGLPAFVILEKK